MNDESASFTVEALEAFLDDLTLVDRDSLVARLEAAGRRLAELGARVPAGAGAGGDWTAHEVLAHMAVVSKFYGVLVYKIGSGALAELDLLANVNLRDTAGAALARLPPADLTAMALADQRRTLEFLGQASVDQLRRAAILSHGGTLTAADIARYPLVAHLEQHLDQLQAVLGDD